MLCKLSVVVVDSGNGSVGISCTISDSGSGSDSDSDSCISRRSRSLFLKIVVLCFWVCTRLKHHLNIYLFFLQESLAEPPTSATICVLPWVSWPEYGGNSFLLRIWNLSHRHWELATTLCLYVSQSVQMIQMSYAMLFYCFMIHGQVVSAIGLLITSWENGKSLKSWKFISKGTKYFEVNFQLILIFRIIML